MGLFSFVGGLIGGGSAKKASKKAAAAQVEAMNKAIAEQKRQYDLTRSDFSPYLTAGTAALGDYGDIVGTNGVEQQDAALSALRESPFFQSLYRTGEEAVLQNAAATGGVRGGNVQSSLADFGADTFARTIQQQLGNLSGLANMGLGATSNVSSAGSNASNNISSLLTGQGQVKASDYLTRGGINSQNWQNFGDLLDMKGVTDKLGSLVKGIF